MPPRDLRERTRLFALAVRDFCCRLPATDEAREVASQLRRAANSVRSNYRAARNGRSRAEFASRLAEAFEEADETRDWLRYLQETHIAHDAELLREATELTRILATAIRTTRANTARAKTLPKIPQT
jgi:four helix bundle protein